MKPFLLRVFPLKRMGCENDSLLLPVSKTIFKYDQKSQKAYFDVGVASAH